MKVHLICPTCGFDDIVKNGLIRRAKQNYKCRDCGRQFVEDPQWKPIYRSTFDLALMMMSAAAGTHRGVRKSKVDEWPQS